MTQKDEQEVGAGGMDRGWPTPAPKELYHWL